MERTKPSSILLGALAATAALVASGCGEGRVRSFKGTRMGSPSRPVFSGVTDAQRFWLDKPAAAPQDEAPPPAAAPMFVYDLPAGWEDVPTTRFRQINTRVKAAPNAECYLTFLEGSGGGDLANVNRWRREVQLPEVDAAAVAALPRTQLLGQTAIQVDLAGPHTNMSGQTTEDARLLGVLLTRPNMPGALFVKFVGPRDVVTANQAAFEAFVASIDIAEGDGGASAAGPLRWEAPAGWQLGAPRELREVTFVKGDCELYVSVLDGRGGGLVENVNRWLKQFGLPPTDAATIAGLERVPCLGGQAVVVEAAGTFSSMGSPPRAGMALVGTLLEQPSRLVTVKLVGPAAEVAADRSTALAFAASLTEAP